MAQSEAAARAAGWRAPRAYVLCVLTLISVFYLLDRTAVAITQELIKREFSLSDTQLGMLNGAVFGIAYAAAGLPIGWLVD
jgi:sugar phosphate permease